MNVCPRDGENMEARLHHSMGWAQVFPCILEGMKNTPQGLECEVIPWPVLAWELVDPVLALLLQSNMLLGKEVSLQMLP